MSFYFQSEYILPGFMNTNTEEQVDPSGSDECGDRTSDRDLISFENSIRILVRKWVLLTAVFLLVFGASVLLSFVMPVTYRVVSVVIPPLPNSYELLDPEILKINFTKIFEGGTFQEMYNNLSSFTLRREFYEKEVHRASGGKDRIGAKEEIPDFETFHKSLAVRRIEKDIRGKNALKAESIEISYRGKSDPRILAGLVNAFVQYCEKVAIDSFAAKITEQIDFEKQIVQNQIKAIRDKATLLKNDRLTLLEEALKDAEKLEIHEEVVLSNYSEAPLYLRGTKSLVSEISNLQKREDSDLFAEDLRTFQQRLFELDQLQVRPGQLDAARVDSYASPGGGKVGPGRLFIIAFGFIAALIISFIVVLLVYLLEKIILMIRRGKK